MAILLPSNTLSCCHTSVAVIATPSPWALSGFFFKGCAGRKFVYKHKLKPFKSVYIDFVEAVKTLL